MDIYKIALDSISAHVAILDDSGQILETNRAWQDFACENGLTREPSCVGMNYLDICDASSKEKHDEPALIAAGIRQVICGLAIMTAT